MCYLQRARLIWLIDFNSAYKSDRLLTMLIQKTLGPSCPEAGDLGDFQHRFLMRGLAEADTCNVSEVWSQNLCALGQTVHTWFISHAGNWGLILPRPHPARHHLAMLSEKLFRRTNLWPADSCVLFQNEHKFPQTSFSSGSDQYGFDKPGHLPGAAGH